MPLRPISALRQQIGFSCGPPSSHPTPGTASQRKVFPGWAPQVADTEKRPDVLSSGLYTHVKLILSFTLSPKEGNEGKRNDIQQRKT